MIKFTVYGNPVAQGRAKLSTVNGHARMYDPMKSRDYKDYVRLSASEHAPVQLLSGPLVLEVVAYRQIPKSFSKKKTIDAENGIILPTSKPDASNYLKGVEDALNGIMWKDDSQITDTISRKRYSERPRIEISIWEVGA